MGHAQNEKIIFLAEITRADHWLSENFHFVKISYVLAELWVFLSLCDVLYQKKDHFQLKQL